MERVNSGKNKDAVEGKGLSLEKLQVFQSEFDLWIKFGWGGEGGRELTGPSYNFQVQQNWRKGGQLINF